MCDRNGCKQDTLKTFSKRKTLMKTLWCLHGNLQQPEVWSEITQGLQSRMPELKIHLVNLWDTLDDDCWAWSDAFCEKVQAIATDQPETQQYLLGYSLGGRLAWHALIARPALWSAAVIVSADPGIVSLQQKEQCLRRDRTWANRFLSEPWEELLTEWDRLPVFCNRPCATPRLEADFDRSKIARAFEVYSKGQMDDMRSHLAELSIPITYITGSEDKRYHQIGVELAHQVPSLRHISIEQAGHRVPWEQPATFLEILHRILVKSV
ncbi:alpha/beta fold hydrolase [Leptolyngbyaceae cyanobacterium CCMR0081]|uniref:Alpha/beta fold hydrolase n=2 Tax=Adonisia TaxID=2950183 RepID=A0A6M0RNQ6_9CYAN|nr:alpha/beta fold hydrolase [Adonisia turfae CCMR0081]